MKRDFTLPTVAIAAGLLVFGAMPAFSQERPSPGAGSGEHAVSRPSGGGGSSSSPSSGSGSSTSSSSGGSSVGSSGSGGGDHAVSRGEGRRSGGAAGPVRSGGPRSVILPSGRTASDPGDRAVYPGERRAPAAPGDYARSRGDRPVTGRAVERPRDISNVPDLGWRRDPYWGYGYWYYDRWMPFYYGPWGGYMYYDPFWWDYYYGYAPGSYGDYRQTYDYDTGSLRLKVKPNNAQVYVDGYFSGLVDDYDGVFQRLKLRAGAHRIELRAEGFQPAVFDVLIVAGETVTYRTEMKPRR